MLCWPCCFQLIKSCVLWLQCVQVTVQTTSSSVMTAAVLTSPTAAMGSNTVQTALMRTTAQTVRACCFPRSLIASGKRMPEGRKTSPPFPLFSVASLVDNSRKSVTHPADLSRPHRPADQTEEAGDASVLQTGPRKTVESIVPPQDRNKATAPQGPSQQEAPVSQGKIVLYSHSVWTDEKQDTRKCCSAVC